MGQPLTADELTGWRAEWGGLRVVVAGAGGIGFSITDTLCELGAGVLMIAPTVSDEHRELLDLIGAELVLVEPQEEPPAELIDFDPELCVVPSGSHYPWVSRMGTPVWGDVELAWRLRDKVGPDPTEWLCVTGDGAGAITELTARMLVAGGIRAAPAGGAGVPAIDAIRDPLGFDILVVELTIADLGMSPRLAPLAGACVEVGDSSERNSYGQVFADNRVACVYGLAEDVTQRLVEDAEVQEGCRAIGVGVGIPGPSDLGIVEDILVDRAFLDESRTSALELATLEDLGQVGFVRRDEITRVLAAAALARAAGTSPAAVRDALRTLPTHP